MGEAIWMYAFGLYLTRQAQRQAVEPYRRRAAHAGHHWGSLRRILMPTFVLGNDDSRARAGRRPG